MLVGLGTWQLKRLGWKQELIGHAQAQLAEAALPLPADGLAALDYRRVSASGSYLHNLAFAYGFFAEHGRPGGRLVTPFQSTEGRVILVDRGWLPEELLPPNLPAGLEPGGTVTVEGVARWRGATERPWMAPANTPQERRWFTWDVPAMGQALGRPIEPLELILERSQGPAGLPRAEPVTVDFPNDHLSYALTWYGLAVVLVVVYIMFSLTKPRAAQP
ncbi:MAG: SURF1 family protein [Actinomycetota bacterium]|nr:SURF1 family protein [Actinomycetota bacterium]